MRISFIYPLYLWLLLAVPLAVVIGLLARRGVGNRRHWISLVLRSLIITAIVFALAGVQLRFRSNLLTTVFILDASDSIPPAEVERGVEVINAALREAQSQSGNQAAVVVFGEDALVERLAFEIDQSTGSLGIESVPVTTRTNIESALQLAQAILPAQGAKRLVLLSDGRENLGRALDQAELASLSQTELLFMPLGVDQQEIEVLIDSLDSPSEVRLGERFDLVIHVESTGIVDAELRVFEESRLIQALNITLQPGSNRILVPVESSPDRTGFRRFRAQIIPDNDNRLQNNEAASFTVVHGPPNILLIAQEPSEAENLARALEAGEMKLTRMLPQETPTTLAELAAFDAVILINVDASSLPENTMNAIPVFVRELGRGLVMIGGQTSFGAGGYLRTPIEAALPVDMDVRDRELQSNLALVLAVDKSGSMGRCHCDNPDLNQTYTRAEVGQPKVDIAKEAVMRAAEALGRQDYLGVVAFDANPHWVLELSQLPDPSVLEGAISAFQAEGQTNLYSGVTAAYQALQGIDARRKHIILLTDGWVRTGELTELAQEMRDQGITLSIVAAGEGSAEYLLALSQLGGGSFYPATDIFEVPNFFLKETVRSVGEYIIEEPFFALPSAPSQVLTGLDTTNLPPLAGYNGTTAKNTARLDLLTSRGDPLLATWQYGLGRSAVWTSDLKNQWAGDWISWQAFPTFATQLVRWVLPTPSVEGIEAQASLVDGDAQIEIQAVDQNGLPLNHLHGTATIVDPELQTSEVEFQQIGPGRYQARSPASQPGSYLVRLGINQGDQSLGQTTLGLVVPYSPEYRSAGIDRRTLGELAEVTGGGELIAPAAAFEHNLPAAEQAREFWWLLLLLVALLFPIDVMLRRLVITRGDWAGVGTWLGSRLTRKPIGIDTSAPQPPAVLGRLFQARDRSRHRREASSPGSASAPKVRSDAEGSGHSAPTGQPIDTLTQNNYPAGETGSAQKSTDDVSQPVDDGDNSNDALARLREAKKRARR